MKTNNTYQHQYIYPLFVLLAGVLWGTIGLFVRALDGDNLSSMDIVMIRAISTSFLLFIYLIIAKRELLKIEIRDIWCFVGTGVCSITFFNFCYFKAITLTSLSVAAVLLYTAPAFVMVMSAVLFKEKITLTKVIAIMLTIFGCLLVSGTIGNAGDINVKGIIYGLGAGIGYALYSIFSRYALDRGYHSLTISFYTFLFSMIGTIPFCKMGIIVEVSTQSVGKLLFMIIFGLVSAVIPYFAYTRGLEGLENSKASVIASIEPVTASILGVIIYHEKISAVQLIGIVLVIAATFMSAYNGRSKKELYEK